MRASAGIIEQTTSDTMRHSVPYQRDSSSAGLESRPKKLVFGVLRDHQAHQSAGWASLAIEAILQRENADRGTREKDAGCFNQGLGMCVQDGHQNVGYIS